LIQKLISFGQKVIKFIQSARFRKLFMFWDWALFFLLLNLLWSNQRIFPTSPLAMDRVFDLFFLFIGIRPIYLIVGYIVIGISITQNISSKIMGFAIASMLVWLAYLRMIKLINLKYGVVLACLLQIMVIGLYLLIKKIEAKNQSEQI
jgi:hypothetical protein